MSTEYTVWSAENRIRGFTLIEVVGALVLFALGVMTIMRVGGALTTQMRYAGARSELVVLAAAQVDSIEAMPFESLTVGQAQDSVTVQGWSYVRTVEVSSVTPILAKIDVELARVDSAGPAHAVTSYTSSPR